MTRRMVEVGQHRYLFSPDEAPPLAARTWAIVVARLLDEITNRPVISPVTIEADKAGLTPRVAEDGMVGLAGIPLNLLPALHDQDYTIQVTFQAEGYLPVSRPATLSQNLGFPDDFTPADLGDLLMHREAP